MPIAMVPKAIMPELQAIMQGCQAITAEHIQAMKDGTATKAGTIIQLTEGITLIMARLITDPITITQATIITLATITQAIILLQYIIMSPITITIIMGFNITSQAFQ